MLKKSVCKKCRLKEGLPWNDLAEAWFKPWYKNGVKTREGEAHCPCPIFDRMVDHMKKLVHRYGTPAENAVLGTVIFIQNRQGSWRSPSHKPPPIWCPYKKEHR